MRSLRKDSITIHSIPVQYFGASTLKMLGNSLIIKTTPRHSPKQRQNCVACARLRKRHDITEEKSDLRMKRYEGQL